MLWKSSTGFHFNKKDVTRAYEDLEHYVGKEALKDGTAYRGRLHGHLERAQVLAIDDQPKFLYMATGVNTTPNHGSCSHVFRIKQKPESSEE